MTKITRETLISDGMISFQIEISERELDMSFDERAELYRKDDSEAEIQLEDDPSE